MVCLAALAAGGCTSLGGASRLVPGAKQSAADAPDVASPAERIASLRTLAKEAPKASPQRQQEISARLAELIPTEEDPAVRAQMVRTLAAYATGDSLGTLRAALEDPEPEVRLVACDVWGRRADAEAARLLGDVLDADVNIDVRLAAARALGQTQSGEAVPALGRALQDKDPAIQYRAAASLGRVTGKDFGSVEQWRQYLAGEPPGPSGGASLAELLRRVLPR